MLEALRDAYRTYRSASKEAYAAREYAHPGVWLVCGYDVVPFDSELAARRFVMRQAEVEDMLKFVPFGESFDE